MAKIPKTATELKDIILERIGVKVTVLPHKSLRWTAIPFTSGPHTPDIQQQLDRIVNELRAEYDLKSR
jgi:hypothetical protein